MERKAILSVCLALLLVLGACAPAIPPTATPQPKGGGGEFRVILTAEPQDLNPDVRSDDPAFIVAQSIFSKLVTLDADYRVIPSLATSWSVSADELTYTFKLKPGVRWHDGQPFTSADVKWTFEAIANQKGRIQDVAARIASIETPDVNTVVMRLKEVWSPFLSTIAWYGSFILPKHIYEGTDWTKNPANQQPVGTGPFKFAEWVKGDHITVAANLDYFYAGPFVDKITYYYPKDANAISDMLLKNQADLTQARPPQARMSDLQQSADVQIRTFSHPARYYLGFNLRRAPFTDLRVRQAINMALDRPALVETGLGGYGAPGLGFYTPAVSWAFNSQAVAPAYDVAAAEALLDQAGLPRKADGTRATFTLVTFEISPFRDVAQAVAPQLAAVGIAVKLNLVPSADFNKVVFEAHDFDLALANGSQGPDPEALNFRYGSSGGYQFMGYSSADFDAAIAEGGRKSDPKERAKAYYRAQEILAKDLPIAPLAEYAQFVVFRKGVTGLPQTEARGLVTFNDYSLVRMER